MSARPRRRLTIEAGLSLLSSALFIVTLLLPDWIEVAFGVDPDHGGGAVEWSIVAVFVVISMMMGLIAMHEWRRPLAASEPRT